MNSTKTITALERALNAIVGPEHVREGRDYSIDGVTPAWVLWPGNEEQVAAVLRVCSVNDLVAVPCGGMTKQSVGLPCDRIDVLLDMGRMDRIIRYDPGDLTIGVEAGVRVSEVEAVLAPHRQMLPLDGPQSDRSTVGGILATATHGPLKHSFGGPRDFCVGVRFVTADGTVAKAGGQVVKNVAGYDLMKLLVGSYGTLAIITSANFKVFPSPKQFRTFVAAFGTVQESIRFRDVVLRSPLTPLALEIVSPLAEGYLSAMIHGGCWHVVLRAGGSDAVLGRYRTELGGAVTTELGGEEERRLWRSLADFPTSIVATHSTAMLLEVSTPMSEVAPILGAAETIASEHGLFMAAAGRAAGPVSIGFLPIKEQPKPTAYSAVVKEIRRVLPKEGAAVVTRCPVALKGMINVWGETPTDMEAMRTVKRALDPGRILNRGRFLL